MLYSFSTEGHKFISMYILLCVLPSLNKGFTYLLTYLLFCLVSGRLTFGCFTNTLFTYGLVLLVAD